MTADQFNIFWTSTYPGKIPIPHYFKYDFADRWFRIHSLPQSKRYADNEGEWNFLLHRHNEIMTELLGNDSSFLLVTGDYSSESYKELHPIEEVNSIAEIPFVLLEPIDLYKLSPGEYEPGQFYKPMFSEQIWLSKKFDNLLIDIANGRLRAFFVSMDKELIIAPYDGGIDFILKDTETKNIFERKYMDWLSPRQDGL